MNHLLRPLQNFRFKILDFRLKEVLSKLVIRAKQECNHNLHRLLCLTRSFATSIPQSAIRNLQSAINGRPSWRPRMLVPAAYRSGTPRNQPPAVARWHAHLRGLATAIHEISGLAPLHFLVASKPIH